MKKSLFHTIMPSDLLAELIKQPEATRGQWAVQFALDLIGDNAKDADSKYAKEIIMATKKFRERKSASGKKGMQKRYDKKEPENSELANSDITEPNTVITKGKVKGKVNKQTSKALSGGGKFKIPTLTEVKTYCQERNKGIDAEEFHAFYESKGWMVGKNNMKSWQSAMVTWEKKKKNGGGGQQFKTRTERNREAGKAFVENTEPNIFQKILGGDNQPVDITPEGASDERHGQEKIL